MRSGQEQCLSSPLPLCRQPTLLHDISFFRLSLGWRMFLAAAEHLCPLLQQSEAGRYVLCATLYSLGTGGQRKLGAQHIHLLKQILTSSYQISIYF